jgi:hypothetical protein
VAEYAANALQLNVTPNPAKKTFSVSSKTSMKNFELADTIGKKILKGSCCIRFLKKYR